MPKPSSKSEASSKKSTARKFKKKPGQRASTPNAKEVEAFASGARKRTAKSEPDLDPKAKATKAINLRLNEYQLRLLQQIAESEDRSIQKIITRYLVPMLEEAAGEG